jgi:hypothetical protein
MYFTGQPSRNPSDPDYVPSIFSYTPLRKKDENIIQAKVERHQGIVEREHQKDRSAAAQVLLKLFEEDENTVPGTETQKLIKIYSNDAVHLSYISCSSLIFKLNSHIIFFFSTTFASWQILK